MVVSSIHTCPLQPWIFDLSLIVFPFWLSGLLAKTDRSRCSILCIAMAISGVVALGIYDAYGFNEF